MKIARILAVMALLFAPSVFAAEPEITWDQLGEGCFRLAAEFTPLKQSELFLELPAGRNGNFVAVHNGQLQPLKPYRSEPDAYVDYNLIKITGAGERDDMKSLLSDSDPESYVDFDMYSDQPKEVVIDLGDVKTAGSVMTSVSFSSISISSNSEDPGEYIPEYFISLDNKTFIHVADPDNFDYRYLKIAFTLPKAVKEQQLRVGLIVPEISITVPGSDIWLFKPLSTEPVQLFSGFDCQNTEAIRKALNQNAANASEIKYSVNSDTPTLPIEFKSNTQYESDRDGDEIANLSDNCPFTANTSQDDEDGDRIGDVCDLDVSRKNHTERDADGDGVGDLSDNCPSVFNPKQEDSNANGQGDLCSDDDRDGVSGQIDNCVNVSNSDQKDINVNGIGDACEFDHDNDGVFDSVDNCRNTANPDQTDDDNDAIGNACDNCEIYNPDQRDADLDKRGDRCQADEEYRKKNDKDADGILDQKDNCKEQANPDQEDGDKDRVGDICDNCPILQNTDQKDENKNGIGDLCEDADNDALTGFQDNCPAIANPGQEDADNDGIGDSCEDDDFDGKVFANDNCPYVSNREQQDTDGDGQGDACDKADNRFLESNRWVVAGLITLIAGLFGFLIFRMLRKLNAK